MADPTFGELGTQSFGSLSLTSSGSSGLGLSSLSLEDFAHATFDDLVTMGYEGTATSSDPVVTPSGPPPFKPIMTTSSALSSVSQVAGQFIVVTDTGDIYVDTMTSRLHLTNTSLLSNNQGAANAGKFLMINSSGQVVPTSLPVYNGEVT